MRLLLVATLVSMAAIGGSATAQAQKASHGGKFTFNGVGTHSCGQYLSARHGPERDFYTAMYQQWGSGFMAGVSNESGYSTHTDLETYTAWLDKWCADDPASSVVLGVIALGKRLRR